MKIVILSGSMRKGSQSLKIAGVVRDKLADKPSVEPAIYDLHDKPIDIDINKVWSGDGEVVGELKDLLDSADGFVVITPEWSGMASVGLKNMFLHVGHTMAHKPGLIVSVSSGRGGAFPVADLRISSYKNSQIAYLPNHLIVRDVENVLNAVEPVEDDESDIYHHKQTDYALDLLVAYTVALKSVRDSGVLDLENFPNGMS